MSKSIALNAVAKREAYEISPEERKVRVDLAAAYRLARLEGWDDLIYTHITARVPGKDMHFLINPFGMAFEEITASSLVKVDLDGAIIGESPWEVNGGGFTIHSAVHGARHDLNCVMHLHTNEGIALSMLDCGLLPLSQHAMLFHNRIAYHDYEGPALDLQERERLIADLGAKNSMILHNHGLLTAGSTVGAAFVRMSYLQRACVTQLQAMATQAKLRQPSNELAEMTAGIHEGDALSLGEREWPAMLRRLDRELPGYAD
jgi:ribulose-5-phosphate 4-epimerase/fuculose-1-phosphate aldolase